MSGARERPTDELVDLVRDELVSAALDRAGGWCEEGLTDGRCTFVATTVRPRVLAGATLEGRQADDVLSSCEACAEGWSTFRAEG